jgi:mitogen-activated protein kinase 1/3
MWALGCILAELLYGKPLFPGKDCMFVYLYIVTEQVVYVLEITGIPTIEELDALDIGSPKTRESLGRIKDITHRRLEEFLPNASEEGIYFDNN